MRAEKQKVLFEDDSGSNPDLPPDLPPVLLVVVDAEEEFDWSGPFTRDRHSVRSMAAQGPMHRIFEKYGIRPTYVVDYPIASQRDGLEPLRDLLKDDACLIGTQLHPGQPALRQGNLRAQLLPRQPGARPGADQAGGADPRH